MTIGTTTAASVIQSALRKINSYQSGDTLAPIDAADCLDALNDLLDSWSTDKQIVFGSNEWILSWTAQKRVYTIGNPTNAQLNGSASIAFTSSTTAPSSNPGIVYPNQNAGNTWPNISGNLTSGSPTITNVTSIPSNLVAGSTSAYQVGSGSILSSLQNLIPLNTTVLSYNAVAQTITMSANATGTSQGQDSIGYTVPGDLPLPRPLRITHGFTRFNQLDFTLDVGQTQDEYTQLLYKAQPGPWPTVAWYNNQFPYGVLNVYQTPGNNAEVHLFTQTVLNNLTLNQVLSMPQGYSRALKWNLALEIASEYGVNLHPTLMKNAADSLAAIKALNAEPAKVSRLDRALARRGGYDAGWILHGGYR